MSSPDTTNQAGAKAGAGAGAILAFVCVGQFMVFLDITIVNLALPSIQRGLDMSDVSLNYVVTAYATVLGGFLLLSGRLADTYGRRRLLQIGMTLFALASAAAALSQNGTMLVIARGFQGLGSAMVATSALSILTNTFPEGPERNKALGIWGSLSGIAGVIGVVLGGVLADGPGWEWIFWINVPIGLAVAALATRVLPESFAERRRHFDFAGAITLTAALLLLIFTLGESTRVGWASARTIGGLIGVAVLFALFLAIESRTAEPLIPLQLFRLRTMATANISAIFAFGAMSAMFFFISIFMQKSFGYSPLKAGFAYVPVAVCVAIGAGVASNMGKIARPVLLVGLLLMSGGLLLMWRAPSDGSYLVDLLPAFILIGIGTGIIYVTLQIAAFVGIRNEDAGVGAGLYNTSQETGGALGLAVIATIAYSGLAEKMAEAAGDAAQMLQAETDALHKAFFADALLALAALLVVALVMPRKKIEEIPPEFAGSAVPTEANLEMK